MLTSFILSAVMWPSNVLQDCKPLDDSIMIGVAQNNSGAHLYCELVNQPSPTSLQISYVLEDKVFAEKKLTYGKNTAIPSVSQKDFRFGELREADVTENGVELRYQANAQKKIDRAVIALQKVDIVDAGFDNFIREHWETLLTGETLTVNFASIAHLKALPLRISLQPLEKCLNKRKETTAMTCFFVEIDNALLRLVLGNIKMLYDEHHRLYEFNGIVNIQSNDQDNQKATIRYFYRADYLPENK